MAEFEVNRDFKGVWIPKVIWLTKDLTAMEKLIWAEIYFLDNEKYGGCIASNKYLADFFGISEDSISKYIARLKEKEYIEQAGYDGRVRTLKTTLKIWPKGEETEVVKYGGSHYE